MKVPQNLSALGVRNFRLFISGQVLSLIGRWMFFTTQDWLVVQLGGHGTALGTVVALQFLPTLLLSPYMGLLVDRFPKRRTLFLTQGYFCLVSLYAVITVATHTASIASVCVQALLVGLMWSLDTPTRQAFVSEMVGTEHLTNAVAINSVVFNTARIVGPSLAGLGIAAFGDAPVFAITFFTQAGVLLALRAMRTSELTPSTRVQRAKGQVREGLRYVHDRPDLMLPIAVIFVVSALALNFPITLALSAKHFHGGSKTYGLLSACLGVGAMTGALFATRRKVPRQRTMVIAPLSIGLFLAAAAVMPNLPALAVVVIPLGASVLTLTTACLAYVQVHTDSHIRGRVLALYLMVLLGSTPIGAPIIGVICQRGGPQAGFAVGAAGALAAGLGAGLWLHKQTSGRASTDRHDDVVTVPSDELVPVA